MTALAVDAQAPEHGAAHVARPWQDGVGSDDAGVRAAACGSGALTRSVDNSEWMRNGDFVPSRWEAQADAINILFDAKTGSNPENMVGIMSMAGKGCVCGGSAGKCADFAGRMCS